MELFHYHMFVYESTIFSILIIWFFYQVLKKKRWVRWERAARDMKDFIKRNEKRINRTSKVIVGIFLIPSFFGITVPAVIDLPNVINKNYLQSEGIVTSWDYSDEDKNEIRCIGITDKEGNDHLWNTPAFLLRF